MEGEAGLNTWSGRLHVALKCIEMPQSLEPDSPLLSPYPSLGLLSLSPGASLSLQKCIFLI